MRRHTWLFALAAAAMASSSANAGTCVLHPTPYKLAAETINWTFKLSEGQDCMQGLRFASMMIDKVELQTAPQFGYVQLG